MPKKRRRDAADGGPLTPAVFHILLALADGPLHGYGIMQSVKETADLEMGPGTIYGSIQRMEEATLVREVAAGEVAENSDARRRYYDLTDEGRAALTAESERRRPHRRDRARQEAHPRWRLDTVNELLYRILLLTYPPGFRRKFGAAMAADFGECRRDMAARRRLGGLQAWRIAIKDLFASAPRERWAAWRRRGDGRRGSGNASLREPSSSGRGNRTGEQGRFEEIHADLRFGARTLRRQPGFTVVAILTLGIGIGAATAIFSVIDAVVLQPLPFREPERLVRWWETTPSGGDFSTSQPNFIDYRAMSSTFEDMAAGTYRSVSLVGNDGPLQLDVSVVTPSMFTLLHAEPIVGRTFRPAEGVFGADTRLAILSERLWRERFSADAGVAGRTVTLDGEPHTVVGVMPSEYDFPYDPDVWVPLAPDPDEMRGDHRLFGIGRLRDGTTIEQARADLEAIAAQLGAAYPESNAGWGVRLASFDEWLVAPELRRGMFVVAGRGRPAPAHRLLQTSPIS